MDNPLLRLLSPQPMQYQQGSGAMPVMQQPQMQPQQMAPNKGMNFMRDLVAGALLSYGGAGVAPVLAGQQQRRRREEEMLEQQAEQQRQNQTAAYFRDKDPELAAAIEQGIVDGKTAWLAWQDKQKGAEPPTPYTDIAKAKRDMDAGYITPEQFDQITSGQGAMDPAEAFKRELDLRKEYSGSDVVKNYGTVRDYYERIRSGVQAGTGAGDIAAVFSYMKMLDPQSTVREGEYATAQNAAGAPEGMRGLYNQLVGGGSLSGKARKQLYDQAQKTYVDVEKNLRDQNSRYSQIADQWQVSPDNVLMQPEQYDPLSLPPTTGNVGDPVPVQAPQPGQIVDGYRFKGGDPANPNSWEQVM
jgi:type II secretory pathway pseudopilin PulG